MDEVYQISSTEKVQQLEQELAAQLAELKAEIEDNRILQGIPSRAYSSVAIPKDASYFRKEREVILKKGLQVTEAKPLVIQADVMQRELESCWRSEHTAANLPLLLHQKRISHIMEEYNDAVQRAARLSAARESFLTGKKNPVNVVTQEDLMIYTRWLVCHLHSLKGIHRFLQVVQKFRSAFCKQQTMRTFPVYDTEVSRSENWGMLDPARALKKRANWIPFLKIKPEVDPWQQKLSIKLKQWKKVDKLMDLHSKFVEYPGSVGYTRAA
ncbi:uncharacterized protein C6orf183 [Spheniscus humboldti]